MTKIAIITDTHFGKSNDSKPKMDHMVKFFEGVFFPTLRREKVSTVFHLGDVFDKPRTVNFLTSSTFRRSFFQPLKNLDIPAYFVVGNHDSYYENTNEVNSLSTLFQGEEIHENFHFIWDRPKKVQIGKKKFLLCPWLNEHNYEKFQTAIELKDVDIVAGHFEFYGFLHTRGGHKSDSGFNISDFKKFDRVWSGHYHHQQQQGNVHYLGSPYEMIWDDWDDPKGFHIYDTETDTLTFHRNESRLFEKVIYVDGLKIKDIEKIITNKFVNVYVKKDYDQKKFDKFWKSLQEIPNHGLKFIDNRYIENVSGEIDMTDIESTADLCDLYVDGRTDISDELKESSKKILKELYMKVEG